MRLHDRRGHRLYLGSGERARLVQQLASETPQTILLCLTLLYTGCRLSEALALTPQSFDREAGAVALVTLKRRRGSLVREIPIPEVLFTALDAVCPKDEELLFSLHRSSAWRHIKTVLAKAGIAGPQAMPKGLRHGFAVNAIQKGVPLDLVSRWMGHASLRTTAIYTRVVGPEERAFAAKMWVDVNEPSHST